MSYIEGDNEQIENNDNSIEEIESINNDNKTKNEKTMNEINNKNESNNIIDNNNEIKDQKNNFKEIYETVNEIKEKDKEEEINNLNNYKNINKENNIKNEKNNIKHKEENERKEINNITNNLLENNMTNIKKNENNNLINSSYSHYSYKPSNYKSLINNDLDLSDTDKFILEKYNKTNNKKYYNYNSYKNDLKEEKIGENNLNKNLFYNRKYEKNCFNECECDFNPNNNYLYNIPKLYSYKTYSLLNKTSLNNYHIPHTQSSIKKGPKYISQFGFGTNIVNYNNNDFYNSISKYKSNDNISKIGKNSFDKTNNSESYNFINLNNPNNLYINDKDIKRDNLNKNNNNIFNYKKEIEKNNLNNNRNNNIFEYDKKIERDNLNNRKNDIEEDFLKKEELCEPYQYQTLIKKNSNLKDYSLINENKKEINNRNYLHDKIISISPTDFYYNTLHDIDFRNIQNTPVKYKPNSFRTYEIDSKNVNIKNNLMSYSSIMRNLILKNKNKYNV